MTVRRRSRAPVRRNRGVTESLPTREAIVERYGRPPEKYEDAIADGIERLLHGQNKAQCFGMGPLRWLDLEFFRRIPGEKRRWRFTPAAQLYYDRSNEDQLWYACGNYHVDGRGFHTGGRTTARRHPVSYIRRATAHETYRYAHGDREPDAAVACDIPRIPKSPRDLIVIARIRATAYYADKGAKGSERGHGVYSHDHREGSELPFLAVSPDGKQLYPVGGSYYVSNRPRLGWLVD